MDSLLSTSYHSRSQQADFEAVQFNEQYRNELKEVFAAWVEESRDQLDVFGASPSALPR